MSRKRESEWNMFPVIISSQIDVSNNFLQLNGDLHKPFVSFLENQWKFWNQVIIKKSKNMNTSKLAGHHGHSMQLQEHMDRLICNSHHSSIYQDSIPYCSISPRQRVPQ